jgi:5-formyltetrahydrofolate cyclo-ligase
MTKNELRKKYLALRNTLSDQEVAEKSLAIANQLLKLPVWNKSYYHIYLSILEKNEVDTNYILPVLLAKEKNIVVSKSNFEDLSMTHYLLTEETKILQNHYGIPEPQNGMLVNPDELDVVFVPLLAFDNQGYRVGYGKGFYDRFLAETRSDCIKIGLSFFDAEENIDDINLTDCKLDFCITTNKINTF